jgi:hypothetical protein
MAASLARLGGAAPKSLENTGAPAAQRAATWLAERLAPILLYVPA